jgi:VWFA-related protein
MIVRPAFLFFHAVWRSFNLVGCFLIYGAGLCLAGAAFAQAQLPYMNAGPESAFVQVDFSQLHLEQQVWDWADKDQRDLLFDSGAVSMRDLEAPEKAFRQFKHAMSCLKGQNIAEGIKFLQKAIALDPEFVSAHNALGLAYLEQKDSRAKNEFETASKLDDKFPGPLLNLGMLALMSNDFVAADSNLEKAATLTPGDPRILTALAFAENGAHKYAETLRTARRVHALNHHGSSNVHYIAAAAAMALQDFSAARQELNTFLTEDSANPLAPIARQTLAHIAHGINVTPQPVTTLPAPGPVSSGKHLETYPNSEHLRAQLIAFSGDPDDGHCENCSALEEFASTDLAPISAPAAMVQPDLFTIHAAVDETALFFAVSHHGHMVNDLSVSDIQIQDDDKPPARILQFIPQSKLPLRLGLLIDISDSVERRFSFEKRAAAKFVEKAINPDSDLAFVAGFNSDVSVTQDFTNDAAALGLGIDKLTDGGETSLFDAVYFACWKLAAYPDQGRVARVLVVLTDGEDNSSHRSLKQSIEAAEAAGVTIYMVSTAEQVGPRLDSSQTDANRVLKVLAEASGGEAIFPGTLNALASHLTQLRDVIRSRYLVAYKAANFAPDGKFHRIRVTAEHDGNRLHVQVRKGYYARLASNDQDR